MVAALNTAGLAAYLFWRQQRLQRAVLVANALFAAGVMTHPYGAFGAICFGIFFAILDWRRFSARLLILAAAPYVVAFSAWGFYILQAPDVFRQQLGGNAAERLG